MLNESQKKRLLEIARQSIEGYSKNGKASFFEEKDPALLEKRGAFVTLTERGDLRGCIGHIAQDKPLYQVVRDMAIEAAFGDPRFMPVRIDELPDLRIEVSILSALERISDPNLIEPGRHGVLIRKGFASGLLLPQVAREYEWGREEFLSQVCRKAGLPADAWKKGAELYVFSAEVFH